MREITLTLTAGQWNIILTILNRLVYKENQAILDKIKPQLEKLGQVDVKDKIDLTLAVDDFNIILMAIKNLPFYDSFDIVNAIITQGQQKINEAVKKEEETKEAKAEVPKELFEPEEEVTGK